MKIFKVVSGTMVVLSALFLGVLFILSACNSPTPAELEANYVEETVDETYIPSNLKVLYCGETRVGETFIYDVQTVYDIYTKDVFYFTTAYTPNGPKYPVVTVTPTGYKVDEYTQMMQSTN